MNQANAVPNVENTKGGATSHSDAVGVLRLALQRSLHSGSAIGDPQPHIPLRQPQARDTCFTRKLDELHELQRKTTL
jgi:hypothetical protein